MEVDINGMQLDLKETVADQMSLLTAMEKDTFSTEFETLQE